MNATTTRGYIDSTSIHEVMAALSYAKPKEWSPWTWQTVQGVTCGLWSHESLAIPPDPHQYAARAEFDKLLGRLSQVVTAITTSRQEMLRETRQWAGRHHEKVKRLYTDLQRDGSYSKWLDWFITMWWDHHCGMHGSLFTPDFVPQISRVLECSETDLARVNELSTSRAQVRDWVKRRPETEDFQLAVAGYVVSVLIRGRYHGLAAKDAKIQIMQHPIRHGVFPKTGDSSVFKITNTERYFTNIILASALAERKLTNKLAQWSENILKVRGAAREQRLDLGHRDRESVAIDMAVESAKRIGVRTHARYLDAFLDAALAVGFAGVTSFALSPWEGFAVGVGEFAVSRKLKIGQRILNAPFQSCWHLRDLATSLPGRIEVAIEDTNTDPASD